MTEKASRNWGLIFLGIALFIVGFIFLFVPGLALVTLATIAGIALLVVGAFDLFNYIRLRNSADMSFWSLLYALCNIALGLMFLVHPLISSVVIPWMAGLFLAAYGVFEIIAAVRERKVGISVWGWAVLAGLVDILCGLMFFIMPDLFGIFLAVFLLMRGAILVVFGWKAGDLDANIVFRTR